MPRSGHLLWPWSVLWFSVTWRTSQASGGTWAGSVIRLNVHLALGQHLGELPLQLLILLVVGYCINRSGDSRCGKGMGEHKGEENRSEREEAPK